MGSKPRWSLQDRELVREKYQTDKAWLLANLNRSEMSIRAQAFKLGVAPKTGPSYSRAKNSEQVECGPWRKRCRCRNEFVTSDITEHWCETCR